MLPETLGQLMEFSIIVGVAGSVVLSLIVAFLKFFFKYELPSSTKTAVTRLLFLGAALLAGYWTGLDEATKLALAETYEKLLPILNALLVALLGGGATFVANQGFYQTQKRLLREEPILMSAEGFLDVSDEAA